MERSVIGWFGFKTDRKLALRALAVAATKQDVHSVFAALTLMTYYGMILLLSGWQADETQMIRQYEAILEPSVNSFPLAIFVDSLEIGSAKNTQRELCGL